MILRSNRVVSATCYFPLSDNLELSKELGTRHRAGLGISEVSDSLTIIISEETGVVSVAYEGQLQRNVTPEQLTAQLSSLSMRNGDKTKQWWKGWKKNEK